MKKIIMIGLAVVIAAVVLVITVPLFQGEGSERPWGVADVDGTWKTELWIVFADGTEVLADDLDNSGFFSVTYTQPGNDQSIEKLIYKVSAKAEGDYAQAYVDLSEMDVKYNIMKLATTSTIYEKTYDASFAEHTIMTDGNWHDLFTVTWLLTHPEVEAAITNNPHEGYSFGFWIDGVINFRGSTDEGWTELNQPALASITLIADEDEIFLDLTGDVTVVYA